MTITPEQLAAFADGELTGADAAHVAAAVAADPALAAQVAAHRALRARLSAHFAPILDEVLPDRLKPPVPVAPADVIDFASAAAARRAADAVPPSARPPARAPRRFGWPVMGAMAAALVLAITLGLWPSGNGLSAQQIAALNTQPSGPASGNDVGILLSFVDTDNRLCRAYSQGTTTGIACRDGGAWQRVWRGQQAAPKGGDMRQAGSGDAELFAAAQRMAETGLSAEEERAAMARGWRAR